MSPVVHTVRASIPLRVHLPVSIAVIYAQSPSPFAKDHAMRLLYRIVATITLKLADKLSSVAV